MGLFPNYSAPGKGVDKNAPKKKGFFLYMDIIFHKFMKFVSANALYSLCSILWLVFLYIIAPTEPLANSFAASMTDVPNALETMRFLFRSLFALVVFNLWGCAPVAAPYAYATRCFTRGEHTWLFSDGWDKFKSNLKQSGALFGFDILMLIMFRADLVFYMNMQSAGGELQYVWQFLLAAVIMVMVVYTLMHYYVYQIMVTYECSFVQLIKNAVICAIADLPMAVLLTVISVGVNVGLCMINPAIVILFDLLVGLCITRYPMEFHATRMLEKNMRRLEAKEKTQAKSSTVITYLDEDNDNKDEDERIFDDNAGKYSDTEEIK